MADNNSICFIGAGYIGGSTAPIMAMKNPDKKFYVVDVDEERINQWNSKYLPIYEPGLDDIVSRVRNVNLFFTTDAKTAIEESKIIFIGVNTPTKCFGFGANEASNLAYWEGAARSIAKYANGPKTIVEKSTLPVKTADAIYKLLRQQAPQYDFTIVSNPEFLAEGTAVRDLLNPDRVLVGCIENEKCIADTEEVMQLYEAWVPKEKIIRTNLWSSELVKLASNAMLAQRVSSINALACVCEEAGADIEEVSHVVGMDSRIGSKFLKAGPGFGGSCFKKDILSLVYICKSLGLDDVAEYWQQIVKMNEHQQSRIVMRILKHSFNTLTNKKVCILGYSFKADTGDTRETPAKKIIDLLKNENCAQISIYDPKSGEAAWKEVCIGNGTCRVCNDPYEACKSADIAVICTDWAEFAALDWKNIYSLMVNQKMVFDARNCIDYNMLKDIGFDVIRVGHAD